MSGLSLSFTADNAPLLGHLARLALADNNHFAGARREIGEFMVGDIQDNLDRQKLFDGSAMPPSKAAQGRNTTWKANNKGKGRKKGDVRERGKTLIDKHHLYDSYVYQLASGGAVEVGSASVYAAIHHFGGKTGRGHKSAITARPVLGVGTRQELQLGHLLAGFLERLA